MLTEDPVHVSGVSHVPVFDILPVHQHVFPAQRPHLALTSKHVALKHISGVPVRLWRTHGIDAVLGEAGHRLSEKTEGERRMFGEVDVAKN